MDQATVMPDPRALTRPSRRPRPALGILLVLPLLAALTVTCTFNAATWVFRVYPSFFLWENNFVPAIGVIDEPAVRAGLRYQSRLLAVDGTPVADREAVDRIVTARPVGTTFRYSLAKNGTSYDISLPSARLGLGVFAVTLGNYLLNALALLALGVAVIFLEPESRSARTFFFFCTNYGLYLLTSIDLVGPSWFQGLYFFLLAFAPVTALQMVIEFPAVPAELARLRVLLPPLYALAVALGTASILAFHRSFTLLMALDRATHLVWAGAFLAALAITVLAFRRPPSSAARERMRIFLLGLVGASFGPAIVLFAVYSVNTLLPLNYLTLSFAVFPAAIAYAIARHDLFGVDRMIRQTVAYVVVTVVVALIYTVLLALVDYVVLPDLYASPAIHVLVTMVLVILFNPLRARIQALVDLVYFRAPYDYRTTVTAASQALASILDVDELVARLVRIITGQMQVDRAEVWLRDAAAGGDFHRAGSLAPSLAVDSSLARYLATHPRRPLHVALGRMGGRVPAEALVDMVAIDAVLAVPLFFEQRLVGFLALGEKRSGRFYSTDDLELLATLANQAAVAVQNARAYRALEETNRELREARDQLIEAERLAAIGELSAAVAHGIRNPVASIKAAAELAAAEAGPDNPLRESFADILTEADALESRIGELLDFARPFVPNHAPADLNEIVSGTLHLVRRLIRERGIAVEVALAADLPPHELDAAQIEQVCLALVTNAIEAMHTGGRLSVATAGVHPESAAGVGPCLELRVRDTGHGIPPDQLPKIFRLFYTRKARGTGVGLATVKRIVDGHHGCIEVVDPNGQGTEFRVLLPLHSGARVPPAANASARERATV
jgi:signal transduction histidine kinase